MNRKKWIIITLLFTLVIGGLKSNPVLASKMDGALTLLEKISLNRSTENMTITNFVHTIISITNESEFLLPSKMVQSHDPEIIELANELTTGLITDEEKSKAIFLWVATNISYDAEAYFQNRENPRFYTALETLQTKIALCSGYAHLNAALHRSIGIEAKVVYGEGHAWNEVKLSGTWQEQDPTYASGGLDMEEQIFVPQLKEDYFSSVDLRREGEFPW